MTRSTLSQAAEGGRQAAKFFARYPELVGALAVFAAPKRIGLKSNIRLLGVLIKLSSITSSDVSTYFRPGRKGRLRGLTFAEAPLSAISRFSSSPSRPKRGGCSKRFVRMIPGSARIWSGQPQITTRLMKFGALRTEHTHRGGKLHKQLKTERTTL